MSEAPSALRRIWLCADDYGISRPVNAAIRDLIECGRLNATSAMVLAPSLDAGQSQALSSLNAPRRRAAIGLHLTLTVPYAPLNPRFRPLDKTGRFLPIAGMMAMAALGRIPADEAAREVDLQLDAFAQKFGRPPDFVDGHQHVHLLPSIRDALLDAMPTRAPGAWVRQCGRVTPFSRRFGDPKGLVLDALSRGLRREAARRGIGVNPGFAGTYTFSSAASFPALFPSFLDGLPNGGVVMCHPGVVDAELERLDPLTTLREQEYAYLKSDAFPAALASKGVALAAT